VTPKRDSWYKAAAIPNPEIQWVTARVTAIIQEFSVCFVVLRFGSFKMLKIAIDHYSNRELPLKGKI